MDVLKSAASSKHGHAQAYRAGKFSNISFLFIDKCSLNEDLSQRDTSFVTNISMMFKSANEFNSNLSDWNASGIADMNVMFYGAKELNSNLSD